MLLCPQIQSGAPNGRLRFMPFRKVEVQRRFPEHIEGANSRRNGNEKQ